MSQATCSFAFLRYYLSGDYNSDWYYFFSLLGCTLENISGEIFREGIMLSFISLWRHYY